MKFEDAKSFMESNHRGMVTTYQAGRLVMLRSQNGVLNTHFRSFDKPMGLAVADNRLAVGAATSVHAGGIPERQRGWKWVSITAR